MTGQHGPLEIELKLEIADDGIDAALAVVTEDGTIPANHTRLVSTYFDTPDGDLAAAGFTLRLRDADGRRVQTVKAGGAAAGLFARPEWETAVDDDRPRIDALAGPLGGIVDADALAALAPRFTVAVGRTVVDRTIGDARIEIAVDRGTIAAGQASRALSEVELELKDGSPAALFALARRIDAAVPVRIGVLAKSDRGRLLAAGEDDKAARAVRVALTPDQDAAQAFVAIAHACLRQFRLNEELLRHRDDATALHQARVGLRRLRSAFSLFRPLYGTDATAMPVREGLRTLAATLGRARDLDVLADRVAGDADRDRVALARAEAYQAVARTLAGAPTRALLLDLVEWLAIGPWRSEAATAAERERPVGEAAQRILDRCRRRLKSRGKHLGRLDDEARHRVRIEVKKLRYATEFFAGLFAGRKATKRQRRFHDAIIALQDHLGELNDRAAGQDHAVRLGVALSADRHRPRGAVLDDAEDAFDALIDARRFWR